MMDRPKIPRHPMERFMLPYLGNVKEPTTHRAELMAYISWDLMSSDIGASFGAKVAFFAHTLKEYGINPQGKWAQSILDEFVDDVRNEMYGGIDEWDYCGRCGEPYHEETSIKFANRVMSRIDVCDKCFLEEGYKDPTLPLWQDQDEIQDEEAWLWGATDRSRTDLDDNEESSEQSASAEESTEGERPPLTSEEEQRLEDEILGYARE